MERLTTNKPVSEMSMCGLAHNCCYVDKYGNARYRDFETDNEAREYAKKLLIWYGKYSDELKNDDCFDEAMTDLLAIAPVEIDGLIALFYRNLWAMAGLRERLKSYEDAEEQGKLLWLPCAVGDSVWRIATQQDSYDDCEYKIVMQSSFRLDMLNCIGKTVFLTKEEADEHCNG